MRRRVKHIFWDHLPFWLVVFCVVGFMGFDIWAMANDFWVYSELGGGAGR